MAELSDIGNEFIRQEIGEYLERPEEIERNIELFARVRPAMQDIAAALIEGEDDEVDRRARPIIYAIDRVNPQDLKDYTGLADEKWYGRICARSSNSIYNQSHIASLIAHHGIAAAESWACIES